MGSRFRLKRRVARALGGNADAHTNCNCNSNRNGNGNGNSNCYPNGNRNCDTNDNTASYSCSTTPSDTGASSVTAKPKEFLARFLSKRVRTADSRFSIAGLLVAAFAKEILENCRALISQNAG